MDVHTLSPVEIADLLDAAWLDDLGGGKDGPDPETRAALADRLGCDAALRAEVWARWADHLIADGCPVDEAEYWLDVEFVQPYLEDGPAEN